MTNPVSCEKAISNLRAVLDGGNEPGPEIVAHWKDCPHCSHVLRDVLRELEGLESSLAGPILPEVSETMSKRGEKEVRRRLQRRLLLGGGMALLVPLAALALRQVGFLSDEWASVAIAVTSAIILCALAVTAARLPGKWGLYRRIGPGRHLGGVCFGLAERTRIPSLTWRLAFLASLLLGGHGIAVYLLLLIAMPVHPDDRQYLLRFRLAHWWRNRRNTKAMA